MNCGLVEVLMVCIFSMASLLNENINNKYERTTRVWQKWRLSAPQTHLWLIKVRFYASTFVVKTATFAKPENVDYNLLSRSL